MKIRTIDGGWSPYFAGALVGLLAVASALVTTKVMGKTNYLGASTTFVRAAGLIEKGVSAEHVGENEYFTKEKVKIDWQFMFLVGIFLGALISSLTDGSFKFESVPSIWQKRFGPGVFLRAVGAFAGGIVVIVGARLADGCPSGHGLSGMMQLSVSSMAAVVLFFAVGIVVSRVIYIGGRP